jgi:hypothetical protein
MCVLRTSYGPELHVTRSGLAAVAHAIVFGGGPVHGRLAVGHCCILVFLMALFFALKYVRELKSLWKFL